MRLSTDRTDRVFGDRKRGQVNGMTHLIGCIQVHPPLNEVERGFMLELLDSDRTLRGSPTGRGDTGVPFAHLGWEVCRTGCCLEWDASAEDAKWMGETLRFVVDHLLRSGAKGQGHPRMDGFTFDHVLSGTVVGRSSSGRAYAVTAADNVVTSRPVPEPCPAIRPQPLSQCSGKKRPANVIEFRPRHA